MPTSQPRRSGRRRRKIRIINATISPPFFPCVQDIDRRYTAVPNQKYHRSHSPAAMKCSSETRRVARSSSAKNAEWISSSPQEALIVSSESFHRPYEQSPMHTFDEQPVRKQRFFAGGGEVPQRDEEPCFSQSQPTLFSKARQSRCLSCGGVVRMLRKLGNAEVYGKTWRRVPAETSSTGPA